MIRAATEEDAAVIADIYNHYILHSTATFEEATLSAGEMQDRIRQVQREGYPYLVSEDAGDILGYAYAGAWNKRSAYRYTAEVTVYLDIKQQGKGLGGALYLELFRRLGEQSIHTVIGGITLPNDASVALHEKFGMKKVAHFPQVGFKFGEWLDVGYWQLCMDA